MRALSCLLAISILYAGPVLYERNLASTLLAVDAAGNAYAGALPNLTKLSPDGAQIYSKSLPLPGEWTALAVDSNANIIIAGVTNEDTLPLTAGAFQPARNSGGLCIGFKASRVPCPDAYVAKVDPSGNLLWASYLGGQTEDRINSVAVDAAGNIYLAGLTSSPDFPIRAGFQRTFSGVADGFAAKISPDGKSILYSTFLGGPIHDNALGIAVDAAGNAFVTGEGGVGTALTPGSFGDSCRDDTTGAFLVKIAPAGDRMIFGGCLGPRMMYSAGTAVAVDASGDVYLGGFSNASDFPLTPGAFDGRSPQSRGFDFIARISADGSRVVYTAQLDGAASGIYSLAVDGTGAVYAAGSTRSAALTVVGPALQPCPGPSSIQYNFVLKLNPAGSALTYLSYEDPYLNRIGLHVAGDGSFYEAAGVVRHIAGLDRGGSAYLSNVCVLNGASLRSHLEFEQPGISPGEIVTLKGTGLGPATGLIAPAAPTFPDRLGDTQVLFDNVPAPLLYVQDRQINAVAPYGIAGKQQVSIQVRSEGRVTQTVTAPVAPTSLAVFQDFSTGAPMVFNQDFTRNSPGNPAPRGSVLILFVTGAGQTSPASADGQVWLQPGALQTSVSAELKHLSQIPVASLPVQYAGPAPGYVSGLQQLNLLIPANLSPAFVSGVTGGNNYLTLTVGGSMVTVSVMVR
jgi:uncharacterized protein (TIGR03437 family)